jgi:hypothetical protein
VSAAVAAEAAATAVGARAWALVTEAAVPLAHFEHRAWIEPPDAFAVPLRPDLGEVAGWVEGVLAETKFRHFRLDRMVMSFHPGQRAKWTAHEALHRLVGWAWWPDMSRLELATMARVAEALPVAAWYAFDEEGRRRCARHHHGDAWGAAACPACDREALAGPAPAEGDAALRAAGRAFLDREIEAALASCRTGRVVSSAWRSVDLASDGLAWAGAHGPRLAHPSFARWVERFVPVGHGRFDTLDALVARVRAVADAVLDGALLAPWPCGAADWVLQDLSQRISEIVLDCAPACATVLDGALADAASHRSVAQLARAYTAAAKRWALPPAEAVFALGYASPGLPAAPSPQLRAGLESAFPATWARLGPQAHLLAAEVAAHDPVERRPLVRRALPLLVDRLPAPLAGLARLEAALADPPPADLGALTLAADVTDDDPLALGAIERVEVPRGWDSALRGEARSPLGRGRPAHVAVRRAPDGAIEIVPLSAAAAAACARMAEGSRAPLAVPAEERRGLVCTGVWVRA